MRASPASVTQVEHPRVAARDVQRFVTVTNRRKCKWCGRPITTTASTGRPREYCKRSCRQRDYEARRRAAELGLGEHELVVAREELEGTRDRLYVLACAIEDVERDVGDEAALNDVREALGWLLDAAKHATGVSAETSARSR